MSELTTEDLIRRCTCGHNYADHATQFLKKECFHQFLDGSYCPCDKFTQAIFFCQQCQDNHGICGPCMETRLKRLQADSLQQDKVYAEILERASTFGPLAICVCRHAKYRHTAGEHSYGCFDCPCEFFAGGMVDQGTVPVEDIDPKLPVVDSTFSTGAEKARTEKLRTGISQIPYVGLKDMGDVFAEGEAKYGRDNWKTAVNDQTWQAERLEHALTHFHLWVDGDRSAAHLAKVAWFCVIKLWLEAEEAKLKQLNQAGAE